MGTLKKRVSMRANFILVLFLLSFILVFHHTLLISTPQLRKVIFLLKDRRQFTPLRYHHFFHDDTFRLHECACVDEP